MLRIIFIFMFSTSAWAACDISKFDIAELRDIHEQFKNSPTSVTANKFFTSLPENFCYFNEIYGYPRNTAGPLYGVPLYATLPKLTAFISHEKLTKKYVSLASESEWEADNVNALQHSYHKLFLTKPNIVIKEILLLPNQKREKAIVFLFDGPHPSKSFLKEREKREICSLNKVFCKELNKVEKSLLKKEHKH